VIEVYQDQVWNSEINVELSIGEYFVKESAIMEAVESYHTGDVMSVSKWNQFVNWITRSINTMLAKLNKKWLDKALDEFSNKDLSGRMYQLGSVEVRTLEQLAGLGGRLHVNPYGYQYKFDQLEFKQSDGKLYQSRADQIEQHQFKPPEHRGPLVKITPDQVRKFINTIQKNGSYLADRLTQIKDHIEFVKKNITEEDRKSNAFQQYVRMLTNELTNDLKIVKFINAFFDHLRAWTVKDDDAVEQSPSSNHTQQPSQSNDEPEASQHQSQSKKKSTDGFPPSVKNTLDHKLIKALCNKFVFKKFPKCNAIYVKLNPDGKTILCTWDTKGPKGIEKHDINIQKHKDQIPWALMPWSFNEAMQLAKEGIVIKK
jgi:cell division septum initiation protein DivIVA